MTIVYKENWRNELEQRRLTCIKLINRLMRIANNRNKRDIGIKYSHIIEYLTK